MSNSQLDDLVRNADPAQTAQLLRALETEFASRVAKRNFTESLREFVAGGWRWVDSVDFKPCWAIDALSEHLEAVTAGDIKRLLINFPPRCGKSTVASICWPAWTWAQPTHSFTSGPQVKFLCSSYSHNLGLILATKTRRLVQSPWYQERWPMKFREDQSTKSNFETSANGGRVATSVGGSLLGIGGDCIVVDDPHDTEAVESDVQRQSALDHFAELSSTRLNDPKLSPIVVIMQRLHEMDVSGDILSSDDSDEWTHLCLPMHYDEARHCHTVLKVDADGNVLKCFDDPRSTQGELLWPDRFGAVEVNRMERKLGPYMASGRLEQMPTPAGGGIIKEEWWKVWPDAMFPRCEYILASLDTAYTEKTENDASAISFWGLFRDPNKNPKVILLYAWEGRLELHDLVNCTAAMCTTKQQMTISKEREEDLKRLLTDHGSSASFLPRFPVDKLIIELKASGHSVAQELQRLYGLQGNFAIEGINVTAKDGDKVARLYSVQHLFADEMVYAPDRRFARDLMIKQVSMFPKGAHDDLVDSCSHALRYLRNSGLLKRSDEVARDEYEAARFRPRERPLY